MDELGRRREPWVVASLLALAAAIRVVAWVRVAAIFDDGPIFVAIAESFAAGDAERALAHPYHPLYAWLVSVVEAGLPGGGFEGAAAFVSVASGTAAVGLVYFFVRRSFDVRTAIVAALLLCIHPLAVEVSSDIQADGLYLACFLAALALLWRSLERSGDGRHRERGPRVRAALVAGVATGLAYLTRPEGLSVAAFGVLGPLLVEWRRGEGALRRAAPAIAAFALGLAVLVVPYVVSMHDQTGIWTLSQKPSVMRIFAAAAGDSAEGEARVMRVDQAVKQTQALPVPSVPLEQRERPASALGRVGSAVFELYEALVPALRVELAGLLVLGCWAARGPLTRRGWLLVAVVVLHLVMSLVLADTSGYVSRRHVLPGVVPLFGVVAVGVWFLAGAAAKALRGDATDARARTAAVAAILLALFAAYSPRLFEERRADRLAVRLAAEWTEAQSDVPGGVGGRRMRAAYYGGRAFVALPPHLDSIRLGRFLRQRGAAFVVVDDERQREVPGLRDPEAAGLVPVHRTEARGRSAVVYRVGEAPAG